jgi:hypothetical protein
MITLRAKFTLHFIAPLRLLKSCVIYLLIALPFSRTPAVTLATHIFPSTASTKETKNTTYPLRNSIPGLQDD